MDVLWWRRVTGIEPDTNIPESEVPDHCATCSRGGVRRPLQVEHEPSQDLLRVSLSGTV